MGERLQGILYRALTGLIIGVVFALVYILIRFDFSIQEFSNCFFLTGFFLFICGLTSFVNGEGFFDMAAYGFSQMPYMFKIRKEKKYEDLIAYKEAKAIKRGENKLAFLGYFITAAFFLLIGVILYLIIKF